MGKTTAALFVPVCESLLLSLICCFLLHAFFSSLVPADYAPATRAAITSTLIINICNVTVHVIVAALRRTSDILPAAQPSADSQTQTTKDESWITYHHALGTANAHCCGSSTLFLLHLLIFLQVATFGDQLQPSLQQQRGPSHSSTFLNEWIQAVVGTAGQWQMVPSSKNSFVAVPTSGLPITGSIFVGILIAFLLVMLFVSMYACFMAVPENAWTYLFFEPRNLVVLNALVVMTSAYSVRNAFVGCHCTEACFSPAVLCVLFTIFAVMVCWLDILIALALPIQYVLWIKLVVILLLAAVPPLACLILKDTTPLFKITAWIIGTASFLVTVLDFLFARHNEKNPESQAASESSAPTAVDKAAAVVPPANTVANFGSQVKLPWLLPTSSNNSTANYNNKQHAA